MRYEKLQAIFCFRSSISAEAVLDAEELNKTNFENSTEFRSIAEYVEIVDPFAAEISFVKSECPQRKVIRIICDQLGKLYS